MKGNFLNGFGATGGDYTPVSAGPGVTYFSSICLDFTVRNATPRLHSILQERRCAMLFAPKEYGQGLIEYAIILSLVALVVIAVVRALGPKLGSTYSTINSSLP
jgi:pilus assembly protein Flp/PilA